MGGMHRVESQGSLQMNKMMVALTASFALTACAKDPNPDWAKCPILEVPSKQIGNREAVAQACIDRKSAALSKGPDSADTIAAAAATMCEPFIGKISEDIKDPMMAEKVTAQIVRDMKAKSAAIVVQVRTWKCLENPTYANNVSTF